MLTPFKRNIDSVKPGDVFNRWTVISKLERRGKSRYLCSCACGSASQEVDGYNVRSGISKSCGCLRREEASRAHAGDLTGETFGRLTVLSKINQPVGSGAAWYLCQCSCGSTAKPMVGYSLTTGQTQSCGCLHRDILSARQHDLTGKRYGRLVVLNKVDREIGDGPVRYMCQCDCGSIPKEIVGTHLTGGHTNSCGCLQREASVAASTTHGLSYSSEHRTWAGMKTRCNNPANHKYPSYGGRGIKVCDAWSDSFETFLKDMGNKPSPDHSIDRIDSNGNYEPLNCRWASKTEQVHNQRGKQAQYHTISPGVFTTSKAILWYLTEICSDVRVISIFGTYRGEYRDTNFFQYCKDTIPNFDEAACMTYLEKHKGIYLIEDLKVEGAAISI